MLNRLSALLFLVALSLGAMATYFYRLNGGLAENLATKRAETKRLKRDLSFLKSLPARNEPADLERSFVSLTAEIAALKEIGGTVARVSTDSTKAGEPIAAMAKTVSDTEIASVPVSLEIREYKHIHGLIEAVNSLGRRDILVKSMSFDQGFFIKAELFGRINHGKR